MNTTALNCSLCNLLGSHNKNGRHFSNVNEAQTHARVHFDQVKTLQDGEIDEGQMVERCFPKSPRKTAQLPSYPVHRTLTDFCRSLFGKHPKRSWIDCNLCGNTIKVLLHGKFLRIDNLINHATIHASVNPFKCRRCENSFRVRSNIWRHFKHVHGTKPTKQDIEDQSEKFYKEISSSIEHCFTKCKDGAPSKEMKNKNRDEVAARSHLMNGPSELAVQRQVFCSRIVKQNVNSNGKLKCRLCPKMVNVKKPMKGGSYLSTKLAIHHAQWHLQKPLYRCVVCNESYNTYPTTAKHLKVKHTMGMKKNHEYFGDEYHLDILAIFAQCFEY